MTHPAVESYHLRHFGFSEVAGVVSLARIGRAQCYRARSASPETMPAISPVLIPKPCMVRSYHSELPESNLPSHTLLAICSSQSRAGFGSQDAYGLHDVAAARTKTVFYFGGSGIAWYGSP